MHAASFAATRFASSLALGLILVLVLVILSLHIGVRAT
jgi:hypothetical protein